MVRRDSKEIFQTFPSRPLLSLVFGGNVSFAFFFFLFFFGLGRGNSLYRGAMEGGASFVSGLYFRPLPLPHPHAIFHLIVIPF